jgi:uncharacterized protein (DUF1330 family)
MTAVYTITQIRVDDWEAYKVYQRAAVPMLQKHGCEVIADEKAPTVLEGEWFGPRTIVLKWASEEAALGWYNSPEYQAILPGRLAASMANLVLVRALV